MKAADRVNSHNSIDFCDYSYKIYHSYTLLIPYLDVSATTYKRLESYIWNMIVFCRFQCPNYFNLYFFRAPVFLTTY